MNEINKALLGKMKKLQYYEFLRYALGTYYFYRNEGYEVQSYNYKKNQEFKKIKLNSQDRVLAYLSVRRKQINVFIIREKDFEQKTFHDDQNNVYDVLSYFDGIDQGMLWLIMMGVLYAEGFSNEDLGFDGDIYLGENLFRRKKPSQYRFILGAGVNYDYGLGSWKILIDNIRNSIRSKMNIPAGNPDVLLQFEESICNTNYIAPQILKVLDPIDYYNAIYQSLYSKFNTNNTQLASNPSIQDTSLYQVARIVSENENSSVLTFNYDDVLEQVLSNNFTVSFYSDYYKSKNKKSGRIPIIHPHGFFPYGSPRAFSIVLSTFEYLEGYQETGSYPRKQLTKYIKKPCILVGNSLSDYEEQKVFFDNHKKTPSNFSFLFTSKSAFQWMDVYKMIYFVKMGVIPVFFDDFKVMANYLKTL